MREQTSLPFHEVNAYKSHFYIPEILLRLHIFSDKIGLWLCLRFLSEEKLM
jgi:hypothetical protein